MKRAEPPQATALSRAAQRALEERQTYQQAQELQESRSMLRGLLILAVLVALLALCLGGFGREFSPGWWRQW